METPPDPTADIEEVGPIDKATQHRYRVFKKNAPFIYDHLTTHSLLWPSLSVQIFPDLEVVEQKSGPSTVFQRLLFGTFTLGQATDNIYIQQLPTYKNLNQSIDIDQWSFNAEKEEFELLKVPKLKLRELQAITHFGDVNNVQYMPQNCDIIAAANNHGNLVVYNRTRHSNIKKLMGLEIDNPQLRLEFPSLSDIFALDWNLNAEGTVAAASVDGHVTIHDIKNGYDNKDQTVISPLWTRQRPSGVNDLQWVPSHDLVIVSGEENGAIAILDIREPARSTGEISSLSAVNSVSVHPNESYCVASGHANATVNIWDIRSGKESLREFSPHTDSITQVKWHPNLSNILGTSSADRTVKIHDMEKREIVFSHEGHMLGVNDFDWSRHDDWMVASVADDNSLHVWKPAQRYVS